MEKPSWVKPWQGKPIGMPGVYADIPIDCYHAADCCVEPSISSGGLRTIFARSPAHYWVTSPYNPQRLAEEDEGDALLLGRAAHHLLFGQADFGRQFAVAPEMVFDPKQGVAVSFSLARTVCKEWVTQNAKGKTLLRKKHMDAIEGMANSLAQEPLVKAGILNGLIELSWAWKDSATGIWLRSRPDATPTDSLDFVDLKTTTDVRWDALQKTIFSFGYYQQGALIAEACEHVLGRQMASFTLVFIEKKPPYSIAIVTLKDCDLDRGRKANRHALELFADGLKSQKWLGPAGECQDARYIEMPAWAQEQIDSRLAMGKG